MKKNILILGAGLMQKPAILSAKELGFKTFVIDADPKAVAVPYADEFCKIDLKAQEEILEYAKKIKDTEGLSAVFTAGTDFSASVSYVCENLGLPGHSFLAAINASVKTQMRSCFKTAGVPSPDFFKIEQKAFEDGSFTYSDSGVNLKGKNLFYPFVSRPISVRQHRVN